METQTILLCLILILISVGPWICVYLSQINEHFDGDGESTEAEADGLSISPQIYMDVNKKRNSNKMNGNGRINGNGIVGYMDPMGNGPVMSNGANGEMVNTVVEPVFKPLPQRKETTAEKIIKPIVGEIINKHETPPQPLPPRPIIPNKPQMPIPQPNTMNTPTLPVIPVNRGQPGFTPDVETSYNKSESLYASVDDKYDMQNSIAYWHSSYP